MSIRNTVEILKADVEIPEIVRQKTEDTLKQIRAEADPARQAVVYLKGPTDDASKMPPAVLALSRQRKKSDHVVQIPVRAHFYRKKHALLAAGLAAVLVLGAGSVAAAVIYHSWAHGFEAGLKPDDAQKEAIEAEGFTDNPALTEEKASATVGGVTVSADQTIVDEHYAMIAFKVEGLQLPEDAEPDTDHFSIEVEGVDCNMSGGFYDGLLPGPDGKAVQENGDPFELNPDGSLKTYYLREDGSYEFDCYLMTEEAGAFFEKNVRVTFEDLGQLAGKLEHETTVPGKWELNWALTGGSSTRSLTSGDALGDSGAVLLGAEISPISAHLTLSYPYREHEETGTDEDGNEFTYTEYDEPPYPYGLKLKDGTLLHAVFDGPGVSGFSDRENGIYECRMRLERLVTPEEIAAVLFVKEGIPEGGPSEEDLYTAEVK